MCCCCLHHASVQGGAEGDELRQDRRRSQQDTRRRRSRTWPAGRGDRGAAGDQGVMESRGSSRPSSQTPRACAVRPPAPATLLARAVAGEAGVRANRFGPDSWNVRGVGAERGARPLRAGKANAPSIILWTRSTRAAGRGPGRRRPRRARADDQPAARREGTFDVKGGVILIAATTGGHLDRRCATGRFDGRSRWRPETRDARRSRVPPRASRSAGHRTGRDRRGPRLHGADCTK